MREYSIDALVDDCKKKGFEPDEIERVRSAYLRTMTRYEERFPAPCAPGVAQAISYVEDKFRVCYTAGSLTAAKIIDDWHKRQGDGAR